MHWSALSTRDTTAVYYVEKTLSIPYFDCLVFVDSCIFAVLLYLLRITICGAMLALIVKSIVCCLSVIASSLTAFEMTVIFLPITKMHETEANFIHFSIHSLIMFVCGIFDLPETRGIISGYPEKS